MATNKNKEKEAAAAQADPSPKPQTAQTAPAPEKADKKTAAAGGEKKPKPSAGILEKVGKAAIARHGFGEVYVTSDGQVFPQQSDARNHAADLANKEITKVTKQ